MLENLASLECLDSPTWHKGTKTVSVTMLTQAYVHMTLKSSSVTVSRTAYVLTCLLFQ